MPVLILIVNAEACSSHLPFPTSPPSCTPRLSKRRTGAGNAGGRSGWLKRQNTGALFINASSLSRGFGNFAVSTFDLFEFLSKGRCAYTFSLLTDL
jgi:hypothetical protein